MDTQKINEVSELIKTGKTIRNSCAEVGISENQYYTFKKNAKKANQSEEQDLEREIEVLKHNNAILREENEELKRIKDRYFTIKNFISIITEND